VGWDCLPLRRAEGFDLIAQNHGRLAREDIILVVLGTGDKEYEEMFLRLQKQFPQRSP